MMETKWVDTRPRTSFVYECERCILRVVVEIFFDRPLNSVRQCPRCLAVYGQSFDDAIIHYVNAYWAERVMTPDGAP